MDFVLQPDKCFFKNQSKPRIRFNCEGQSIFFKVKKENVNHKTKVIARFNEIKNKTYTNSIVVYTDRPIIKDNQAGSGAVIFLNDEKVWRIRFCLEETKLNKFNRGFFIYEALEYVSEKSLT